MGAICLKSLLYRNRFTEFSAHLSISSTHLAISSDDLAKSSDHLAKSSAHIAKSSDDLAKSLGQRSAKSTGLRSSHPNSATTHAHVDLQR